MKKKPKVSVIMSEYNTPVEKLDSSIQSILKQTYSNFEFIIVDDCGKNNLEKFVQKYEDDRIIVINNEENEGLVASLNKAISYSKGRYLVRMDTDDYAYSNRIFMLYDFIKKNPQYAVVSSRAVEVTDGKDVGILGKSGEKGVQNIVRGDGLVHPGCIFDKKAIEEVGGYKNFKRAEDLALWFELLLYDYRLYTIEDVLLRYTVDPEDYKKRKFSNRIGELQARIYYNKKLKGGINGYIRSMCQVY